MISKRLEAAINAQINAELWSAYLYLSMSTYCQDAGFPGITFSVAGKVISVRFAELTKAFGNM